MDWNVDIVDPLWFRMQSVGSLLHSDIAYIFKHTNLFKKISGQKLLISGIDLQHKETYIGKKANVLKQKLDQNQTRNCPLCSYRYNDNDEQEQHKEEGEIPNDFAFCEQCCDSRFGLFTVWTALDYFKSPFNSGSMVFACGSHNKYTGYRQSIVNNHSVPNGYSNKSITEKQNLRWGYVNDIKPGDQFIFNVKTLHAASDAKDGFFRPRIDMRVALRPTTKRYLKELNDANLMENNKENINIDNNNNGKQQKNSSSSNRLGLSQLCSQPMQPMNNEDDDDELNVLENTLKEKDINSSSTITMTQILTDNTLNTNTLADTEMSPELGGTTLVKSKHLSFNEWRNDRNNNNKPVLRKCNSSNDIVRIVNGDGLDAELTKNVIKSGADNNDVNDNDDNNNDNERNKNMNKMDEETKLNDNDNLSMHTNVGNDNDGHMNKIVNIQDLPTQANDS